MSGFVSRQPVRQSQVTAARSANSSGQNYTKYRRPLWIEAASSFEVCENRLELRFRGSTSVAMDVNIANQSVNRFVGCVALRN